MAMFDARTEGTLEDRAVRRYLCTFAIFQVILELTSIPLPIRLNLATDSVRFIVYPLAPVDIPVGENQPANTMRLVLKPLPVIFATVRPELQTKSLPHVLVGPLPFVDGSVLNNFRTSVLDCLSKVEISPLNHIDANVCENSKVMLRNHSQFLLQFLNFFVFPVW